jgi:hypothetical protein
MNGRLKVECDKKFDLFKETIDYSNREIDDWYEPCKVTKNFQLNCNGEV